MTDLSKKTACVIDFGNHVKVAQRLSKDFGTVLWWCPFVINGYPEHNPFDIGRGVPGIQKVENWEDYYEQIDIFIFPHIYFSGLQDLLRRQGKLVFGCGGGDRMETNRGEMKRILKMLDLPVNDYEEVEGVYELEELLKRVEDRWVKSSLRGDMETFHHVDYISSVEELKEMKHKMGVYDRKEKYIVESPINAIAEIGIDTMVADGKYLEESFGGIEIKDVGFIGKMMRYDKLPLPLKNITDKLSPMFAAYGYKGAYSNEIRIDEKNVGYLTDQTCRFPIPPTTIILNLYKNFSEVVWTIANGEIPNVKYIYEWGCQFIIRSESGKTKPVAFQFPKEYDDFIDIKNLVVDDYGTYHYTPNGTDMSEIASVCGVGHTMEEAIKMATKIAKSIKGPDLKINYNCIEEAKKQISDLSKNGIKYL